MQLPLRERDHHRGLVHCGVRDAARFELGPGLQRLGNVAQAIIGPTEAEQGTGGKRTVEAYTSERGLGCLRLLSTEIGEAEGDIGLVAQGEQILVCALHLSEFV
ncbi:MAG: hypothetical protein IPK65_13715 [Gammaproteobacteria bacterium]|nr:hypothetical protein [Gammaproteobacteria bacterium]